MRERERERRRETERERRRGREREGEGEREREIGVGSEGDGDCSWRSTPKHTQKTSPSEQTYLAPTEHSFASTGHRTVQVLYTRGTGILHISSIQSGTMCTHRRTNDYMHNCLWTMPIMRSKEITLNNRVVVSKSLKTASSRDFHWRVLAGSWCPPTRCLTLLVQQDSTSFMRSSS